MSIEAMRTPLDAHFCFKKQDPAPETSSAPETECKPFGPNVLEIAKLISSGDEAVLNDVSACIENPADWYDACREQLFIRNPHSVLLSVNDGTAAFR